MQKVMPEAKVVQDQDKHTKEGKGCTVGRNVLEAASNCHARMDWSFPAEKSMPAAVARASTSAWCPARSCCCPDCMFHTCVAFHTLIDSRMLSVALKVPEAAVSRHARVDRSLPDQGSMPAVVARARTSAWGSRKSCCSPDSVLLSWVTPSKQLHSDVVYRYYKDT